MTDLTAQRRLAADVLDVGKNRIWFDPSEQGEIAEAITREAIEELIEVGIIQAKPGNGNSRGRARERNAKRSYGHQSGPGSRKGRAGARQDPSDRWRDSIRAQRQKLRELRDEGEISPGEYRELYRKASGGEFRSVRYMLTYIDQELGDR